MREKVTEGRGFALITERGGVMGERAKRRVGVHAKQAERG